MDKREYCRQWAKANQEKIREYREKTKDRRNARRRELYQSCEEHREKAKRDASDYRQKHPLRRKLRPYGLSEDAFELMGNEGCAICGAHPHIDATVKLKLDHDHRTGKLRGLLCNRCNVTLGYFCDDPDLFIRAARYLLERSNG